MNAAWRELLELLRAEQQKGEASWVEFCAQAGIPREKQRAKAA